MVHGYLMLPMLHCAGGHSWGAWCEVEVSGCVIRSQLDVFMAWRAGQLVEMKWMCGLEAYRRQRELQKEQHISMA